VITYRTFLNTDPPHLADLWNACFTGRGAALLHGPTLLEYFTFSKPYFDPAGLFVACAGGLPVGFAHAGFGADDAGKALRTDVGVTCVLAVHPDHRGRGAGAELLRRCEDYLRRGGAKELTAGPLAPLDPFTFGLYGGSESAGFLESDAAARPFLEKHGYRPRQSALVYQRPLDRPLSVIDVRFPPHRQRYDVHGGLRTHLTWWQDCVLGPLELHEYRLVDKLVGHTVARASLWEMETFNGRWEKQAVGMTGLEVVPELRRRGLGKFLLVQLIRFLQEQFFGVLEVHIEVGNVAAAGLLRGLNFDHVDTGHSYRREGAAAP
jgi:ribosomal protein S18 acetylase RimI-like enzyme